MSTPTTRRRRKHVPLAPRVKVWLEVGGDYAFGLGVSDILQAVDRAGSIKRAAADLGKSYRHVWGRVKQAERVLGRPLVETQVGGQGPQRSCLTPEARRLVASFGTFRSRMIEAVRQEFLRCFG
jgi:molybdate transport system regulatory protein